MIIANSNYTDYSHKKNPYIRRKTLLYYKGKKGKMAQALADVTLYVTDECIRNYGLLKLDLLIPIIEKAMASVSKNNEVVQPPRMLMSIPSRNGVFLAMPAFSEPENAMACKLVTAYPKNVAKGLPAIIGTVILFDADTGKVSALMDGTEITTWRTAAASFVATKHIYKGTPEILAVLGAGIQAGSHAETFDCFYKFSQIRIWNVTSDKAQTLASKLKEMGKSVLVCKDVEECVKNADVIVTATFSETPLLKKEWVKPGAHINAVGVNAASGHLGELEMELYKASAIYTDSMEAAKLELKPLFDAGIPIEGEVGEIINGTKKVPENKITVFQSLGMAVEDVVSAKLIYEEYKKIKKSCTL